MTDDIAIAHGSLTSDGGAERVALELAREFSASIYAAEVDDEFVPADVRANCVFNSRLASWLESPPPLVPNDIYWAIKHLWHAQRASWIPELYDYDTVIVTKGDLAWYVPRDDQTVVRYLHSTPRRAYDLFHHEGEQGTATRAWAMMMRTLRQPRERYPDTIVANSETVAQRARKYWRVDDDRLEVVHPPVDTTAEPQQTATDDYLFAVGRLAQNKRIPLLCEVAKRTNRRVVVAGDGPERDRIIKARDAGHLEWLGYIAEAEKKRRLSEASATLMLAENEDFGIVPIESMAAGTPVIGVSEGFTKHQIREGCNGLLCQPSVNDVVATIEQFSHGSLRWSEEQIAAFAEQFSKPRFRREMRDVVADAQEKTAIDVDFREPVTVDQPAAVAEVETDGGVER